MTEGPRAKECGQTPEMGEGQETDFRPEPPGSAARWPLGAGRLTSRVRGEDTCAVCSHGAVVICYSRGRPRRRRARRCAGCVSHALVERGLGFPFPCDGGP